jgi:hypothetical protein
MTILQKSSLAHNMARAIEAGIASAVASTTWTGMRWRKDILIATARR